MSQAASVTRRVASAALYFPALFAVLWWLSWQAYERHLVSQSAHRLALIEQGGSPFSWDFSSAEQLIQPDATGLVSPQFGDQGLFAAIHPEGGHLSMRLNGAAIPAARFTRLQLSVDVSARNLLQVYWREHLDGPEYGHAGIRLRPGLNRIDLDLAQEDWVPVGRMDDIATVPWGGQSGAVRLLRIHPGRGDDFVFNLRSAILLPESDLAAPQLLELPDGWLTPEFARWHVEQALLENADQLPVPTGWDLDRLRSHSAQQSSPAGGQFVLPIPWVGALALLIVVLWRLLRPPGQRVLALLDLGLAAASAILLLAFLPLQGATPHWALLIALSLVLLMTLGNKRGFNLHWTLSGPPRAWLEAFAVSLPLLAVLVYLAVLNGGEQRWQQLWPGLLLYLPWAFLQQFVLGPFMSERLALLIPGSPRSVAALVGILFALCHYPNFALMCATGVMGALWSWVYLRYRGLLPQALMHGLLGSCLFAVAPAWLMSNAAVGLAFYK